jgi:cell division protease FtsH
VSDPQLAEFGRLFSEFLRRALEAAPAERSELVERLTDHLGTDPVGLPVVSETYEVFEHANLHLAVQAYVTSEGCRAELVGIGGGAGREHHTLSELLSGGFGFRYSIGTVEYASVPVGAATDLTVVRFGLFLISDGDVQLAALLRGTSEMMSRTGRAALGLEVLCADPAAAQRMLSRVRELMATHNVFRGQVVSFEEHEFSHGVGPLRFHARPVLGRDDVILPAGTLAEVERQIIGVAEHRERLRAAGHPLKRGVLLFGPPGTGKTHTVRYLTAALAEFTVVLMSGLGLRFVQQACALARLVQPALVVLEDVDLVAESRNIRSGMDNPLLYQVLNEMDGLPGDADVAFVLTTNRVDLLEEALAQRPGRVDVAMEVPLPDEASRRRLLRLYGRRLALDDEDVAAVVVATDGVTASFFAELARRATLLAAVEGEPHAGGSHVQRALTELQASRALLAATVPGR